MALISTTSWHSLGLGVATTWVALGLVGIFQPARSADLFGISTTSKDGKKSNETGIALMLGSRDLTIAAALFGLLRAGKDDETGTLLLSTMIICGIDVYLVWKAKRYPELVTFAIGTVIWGTIGLGLKGVFN